MKTMFTTDAVYETTIRIENYQRLIKLIKLKSIDENKCTLSHKVMANFLDVTQADITRWINTLIAFGIIKKVGAEHAYKAVNAAIELTILDQVSDLLRLLKEEPYLSFEQQAIALEISINDLEVLYGFLIQLMG